MIKVGLINTNREPYPTPQGVANGGLTITGLLADNLNKDLFDTYFFTTNDTISSSKTITFDLSSYFLKSNKKILNQPYSIDDNRQILNDEQEFFTKAIDYCNKNGIDIFHVHNNIFNVASLFSQIDIPVVFTSHDPITPKHYELLHNKKNVHFITISKKQHADALKENLSIYKQIYNGIDTQKNTFDSRGGDNLLFVGRLISYKGINEAIDAAVQTYKKLDIVGQYSIKPHDLSFNENLKEKIKKNSFNHFPMLNKVEIVGKYQKAKLTLFPSLNREEPCPLVPIESMSCGTPTVGFAQGAFPELVKDGETGYIVNVSEDDVRGDWIIKKTGIAGLCEAIEKIYSLNTDEYLSMRKKCREHVERAFSLRTMIDNYENLYKEILKK